VRPGGISATGSNEADRRQQQCEHVQEMQQCRGRSLTLHMWQLPVTFKASSI
jgi:hypothetical protein